MIVPHYPHTQSVAVLKRVDTHTLPVPPAALSAPTSYRLSLHCKHMLLFTRTMQAEAFRNAYKALPVFSTTLRELGNFKEALLNDRRVYSIRGITDPRAFELRKAGEHQVTVGMKDFMHHEMFTGRTAGGIYEGEPLPLFRRGIPLVEEAPAWDPSLFL